MDRIYMPRTSLQEFLIREMKAWHLGIHYMELNSRIYKLANKTYMVRCKDIGISLSESACVDGDNFLHIFSVINWNLQN